MEVTQFPFRLELLPRPSLLSWTPAVTSFGSPAPLATSAITVHSPPQKTFHFSSLNNLLPPRSSAAATPSVLGFTPIHDAKVATLQKSVLRFVRLTSSSMAPA